MRDPWNQLKRLPWPSLMRAALATVLVIVLVEYVVGNLFVFLPDLGNQYMRLMDTLLGVVISFGIGLGVGAMGVSILEYLDRSSLRVGNLWGMLLCLLAVLIVKEWIQDLTGFPLIRLAGLTDYQPIAFVLGAFWKGRYYR